MNAPAQRLQALMPSIRRVPLNLPDQVEPVSTGDVLDLSGMLNTLWRGKGICLTMTLLGAILGLAWAIFATVPLYRATTVLVMEGQQEQVVDFGSLIPSLKGDLTAINTEVEVLRSTSLLHRVATALALDKDPEFNSDLRDPGWQDRFITAPLAKVVQFLPEWLHPRAHRMNAVVEALQNRIFVRNIPDSLVFEVVATTTSSAKSARITDKLADTYILDQIETKFAATEQATGWLSARVADLKTALEQAEAQQQNFASKSELVSPEALQVLANQLKGIRDRLEDARALRHQTSDKIVTEKRRPRSDEKQALARIDTRLQTLEKAEKDLSAKIERQSGDLVTLEQFGREVEASRLIYEYFLSRLKETSVQQGIQKADSRILSRAVLADSPATPQLDLIGTLSAAIGLVFGCGLVLAREARQNTFRTAVGLEMATGRTVLGQIPRISARRSLGVLEYLARKPTSAAAEAVRNLRTSLLLSDTAHPPQVIMSTSSLPNEGKTTHTLALAQNMAAMGKKVLVIEGDIRRRAFADYFRVPKGRGLITAMSGEVPLNAAVWYHEGLKCDILVGENTDTNAADLFSTQRFERLLGQARKAYDVVLIDTPPVLAVPDARVIGQLADAVLYTVRWDRTRREQVAEGMRRLETVGLSVTGLVLGQINPTGQKRYGYNKGDNMSGYYAN